MRHDTFTTVPPVEFRTDAGDHAHDQERAAWRALAGGDRTTAAAMLAAAASAHAMEAGIDEPPAEVWLTQKGGVYRAAVCARIARELRGELPRAEQGRPLAPALHLAPPGWSIDYLPYTTPGGLRYGSGCLSGYGDDWTAHVHELAPDALVIDKRSVRTWEDLSRLAVSGPMPGAEVPEGMRDSLSEGIVPWRDQPQPDRDPRFGNARSFDRVALDVYCRIAHRFGARVMTLAHVMRECPDIPGTIESRERMQAAA